MIGDTVDISGQGVIHYDEKLPKIKIQKPRKKQGTK